MAKKSTTVKEVPDLPIGFKGVTIGKTTIRVGCSVERSNLPVGIADKLLCGARLKVVLTLGIADPEKGDATPEMAGMPKKPKEKPAAPPLETVADSKAITVKPTEITFGLTLAREEVDDGHVAQFSNKRGTASFERIGNASDEANDSDEAE